MTMYDQQKTTYSDSTPAVRVISEAIRMIDPIDTPLLAALGGLDSARGKFNVRENGTKIELLEDEYTPTGGTIDDTAMDTDCLTAHVADASVFQVGHVIKIQDEYMVIGSLDLSTNIITVLSSSYGGTNAEHTSTNGTISIVGMARLEGADADFISLVDITAPFNYTSIYEKALNVSGTDEAIDYYGMASPFAYQAKKSLPELFRMIELALFHGIRAVGTAALNRSFGGFMNQWIGSTNNVAAGGQITKSDVIELSQAVYTDGGQPDILVMNPEPAKDLAALLDNSNFLRVSQTGEGGQLGMNPVTHVVTQFGSMQLVVDRWCPLGNAFAIDTKKAGLYTLRPFAWKALAVTGDSKKGEVVGEFSLLVANAAGLGQITGIT